MAGISDESTMTMELRVACSTDDNKLLFDFDGPETLEASFEAEVLRHINSIAVKACTKRYIE